VRTIVTRPRLGPARAPALLFIGWLSCDSIALRSDARDGWSEFLRALISRSGFVVMRVDKPGVGESEGNCGETDFETEVAAYRAAYQALARLAFVDAKRIGLVGASMGGAIAPLIAQGTDVAAVAVWGTFSKSWLEHMLELERRRLDLLGERPGAVTNQLARLSAIHAGVLLDRSTPRQVLERRPGLGPSWYGEPGGLYGRPAAFFHQAQQTNIAAAWERVRAPVLAVHGEYDWIMSRDDHALIARIVDRARPGRGHFLSIPRTDHHFEVFDTPAQAFRGEGGRYDGVATDAIVRFLRRELRPDASPLPEPPRSNRDLFRSLVGEWDVEVSGAGPDGRRTTAAGSWHFEEALEGAAIQDVWKIRDERGATVGHGMTVRFYDEEIDAWRVTWHGVLSRSVFRFLARKQGSEIVMDGLDDAGDSRWIFYELGPSSFRWRAVASPDAGRTWVSQQEMVATRRASR
jgi:dienelactone hydrolase